MSTKSGPDESRSLSGACHSGNRPRATVLGPLNLDLLGLVVDLNQVVLDLTARPGAGNLLGNLLCGVLGLLDIPGAIAAVTQLLGSLNTLLPLLAL